MNNSTPSPTYNLKPRVDLSKKYDVCGQLGYYSNSEDRCMVFVKWMSYQQASQRLSEPEIKGNVRKYFKKIRKVQ